MLIRLTIYHRLTLPDKQFIFLLGWGGGSYLHFPHRSFSLAFLLHRHTDSEHILFCPHVCLGPPHSTFAELTIHCSYKLPILPSAFSSLDQKSYLHESFFLTGQNWFCLGWFISVDIELFLQNVKLRRCLRSNTDRKGVMTSQSHLADLPVIDSEEELNCSNWVKIWIVLQGILERGSKNGRKT